MVDLEEILICQEHEAPYIIGNLDIKRGKGKLLLQFTVICPVDQKLEKISVELPSEEMEKYYQFLADKTFRCEKCFREAEILDAVIHKTKVDIYLKCIEHGRLITREISPEIYDKIRFAWDTKDLKKEEEKIY